ncbi:MAG: hypothetical protein KGJ13_05275 [Patescibacteria group bacterium]|nr:hypothetical protein [Patescibacteria group bacterium]
MTILDCYVTDCVRIHPAADDCPECQGIGEIEGEAVNRNGPYSVIMDCPKCKGSGKIDIELPEDE